MSFLSYCEFKICLVIYAPIYIITTYFVSSVQTATLNEVRNYCGNNEVKYIIPENTTTLNIT